MTNPLNIRDLIAAWPTRKHLADEIGASVDIVHKWATFGRIPSDWQAAVLAAAHRHNIDITADWMIAQHARTEAAE